MEDSDPNHAVNLEQWLDVVGTHELGMKPKGAKGGTDHSLPNSFQVKPFDDRSWPCLGDQMNQVHMP